MIKSNNSSLTIEEASAKILALEKIIETYKQNEELRLQKDREKKQLELLQYLDNKDLEWEMMMAHKKEKLEKKRLKQVV